MAHAKNLSEPLMAHLQNSYNIPCDPMYAKYVTVDWLVLHLKFGSVYIIQLGGTSGYHADQ